MTASSPHKAAPYSAFRARFRLIRDRAKTTQRGAVEPIRIIKVGPVRIVVPRLLCTVHGTRRRPCRGRHGPATKV